MYALLIAPARASLRFLSGISRLVRRGTPKVAEVVEDEPFPEPFLPRRRKVAEVPPARARRPLIKLPLLDEGTPHEGTMAAAEGKRSDTAVKAGSDAQDGKTNDLFSVLDAQDRSVPLVEIADFDTAEDALLVTLLDDSCTCDTVELWFDARRNAVRATHDGHTVALLLGLSAADIPYIHTAVVIEEEMGTFTIPAERIAA